MGMTDDWQRLDQLDKKKGGIQYGQYLQVTPAPGNPDLVLASKDLVLLEGEKTDVNAWRVYLGAWKPRPDIPIVAPLSTVSYADPTPWAPPEPRNFDAFPTRLPLYARVQWSSGGIQHEAFVDWPRRGCLIQISGNYVRVNAFVNVGSTAIDPRVLPLVQATIAPEPGGGDSAMPATFTYRPENGTAIPVDPPLPVIVFRNFQIPPFARAFVPIINWAEAIAGGVWFRFGVVTPTALGFGGILANPTDVVQSFTTALTGATLDDQCCFMQPIPLSGQDASDLRIESNGLLVEFGVMFLLDL